MKVHETLLPTHTSEALLPGGLEMFELRMVFESDHTAMTVAHVRAVDLAEAERVGRRYCAMHCAEFVAVTAFCVADPSILDEIPPQ